MLHENHLSVKVFRLTMKSNVVLRIRMVTAVVFLFASILVVRLYFVQIVYGQDFSNRADRQYVMPSPNLYDRGSIFFEDKDGRLISGATLKSGFTIALNPGAIEDPYNAYNKIASVLSINKEQFKSISNKKNDQYEENRKKVSDDIGNKKKYYDIPGLGIYKERWRFYPGGTLAAHTLGFVGYDGDELSGRYGLERYYNDTLTKDNNSLYINFFAEIFANISVFNPGKVKRTGDIITSIEPSVQLYLEDRLEEVHTKWNSKQTAGIIMNPRNGEIYAIGVYPVFNLNSFAEEDSLQIFSNPIVESVYEMGSIVKPLTMAAGIDTGVITSGTMYNDRGTITLDGATISNFDGKGRGRVSMQDVLSQSLNTGAVFVVARMGNDIFREYMLSYGVGEETGIDLPNESAGLVDNLNSPRDIEYATASFGQGIAMTPISIVRALSTLANEGVLVTPHVVKKIRYDSGITKKVSYNDGERVLKKETAEEVTRMLVQVVDEALLGGKVKIKNYSVAAKTGTAQIAKSDERGYYDDRFFHSFFGYFPAYDAQFLIFLYTLEPKEVRYASQTLTHPFMDIVSFLINYYEVLPDR